MRCREVDLFQTNSIISQIVPIFPNSNHQIMIRSCWMVPNDYINLIVIHRVYTYQIWNKYWWKCKLVALERSATSTYFDCLRPNRDVTMQVQESSKQIIRCGSSKYRCMGALSQSHVAMHMLFGNESYMAINDSRVVHKVLLSII